MKITNYDIDDLRWLELCEKLKELISNEDDNIRYVINYENNNIILIRFSLFCYMEIFFYNYRRATFNIVNTEVDYAGKFTIYSDFGKVFETLPTKYQEVFVFYLDLFQHNPLDVAKQYEQD
jgi:hypothetical protein